MNWVVIALSVIGGLFIGYAWGLRKLSYKVQVNNNVVLAVIWVTAELTYGTEWFDEFIEEAKMVMKSHPELITERAKAMTMRQILAEKL